jgi:6-pyruvoyltetrahydropterin/6-carboxytetrahydropterin synthase
MFELTVERFLYVCHGLILDDGEREPMHWHRWQVEVQVSADRLNELGFSFDFRRLDVIVGETMAELDGKNLNELPELEGRNSSTEVMAELLYGRLVTRLRDVARLDHVTIVRDEALRARVTYRRAPVAPAG